MNLKELADHISGDSGDAVQTAPDTFVLRHYRWGQLAAWVVLTALADRVVLLDPETETLIEAATPADLIAQVEHPTAQPMPFSARPEAADRVVAALTAAARPEQGWQPSVTPTLDALAELAARGGGAAERVEELLRQCMKLAALVQERAVTIYEEQDEVLQNLTDEACNVLEAADGENITVLFGLDD